MKDRGSTILQAIVRNFIQTATPVGSEMLRKTFSFPFSSATIRNEMGRLEEEGFLHSPHISAGRIPTEQGFRFFVANCRDDLTEVRPNIEKEFTQKLHQHLQEKRQDEKVYDAISVLTSLSPNVAFGSIPSNEKMFFLGFSNVLQQPEFSQNPAVASGIFKVLEHNFEEVLRSLEVEEEVKIFIGNENVIPEIQSCSLVVTKFDMGKRAGFLGILGPMRMDYSKNIVALEVAREFLES